MFESMSRSKREYVNQLLLRALNQGSQSWTLQGMGMFRLYLSNQYRLHIWHSAFKTRDVTMIHDHPWNFESHVLAGRITNLVYQKVHNMAWTHRQETIVCGPGGGLCDIRSESCSLVLKSSKDYLPGESYREKASEIHETVYQDGTITLVDRNFLENTEHAHVFPEFGKDWISAEPRPADSFEVANAVTPALLSLLVSYI